jgi:hypothetical protein
MELEEEVLSSVGDPLVHSQIEGPLIVLEGAGLHSGAESLGELHHRDELLDETLQGQKGLEGIRERSVLGFKSLK